MDLGKFDTIHNWEKWKQALATSVDFGQDLGISDDTMAKMGTKIGDFLTSNVDPENKEQRLLQQLWTQGDDKEREALTKMIVKMVKQED